MSNSKNKGVHISLSKNLAERLAFVRRFKHRLPALNDDLEATIASLVSTAEKKLKIQPDAWRKARPCPSCAHGTLVERRGKRKGAAPFMGCSRFPDCRHSESITKNQSCAKVDKNDK